MKIWIDLSNSPHVLIMKPLARVFRARGHEVVFTARDFAQTVPLARRFGLECTVIGRHGGKHRLAKVLNIAHRALALRDFGRRARPDLALSHNSYAHAIAAWSLGIPSATMMDYEYQPANHISFRLADRVIVPRVFPESALRRFGARPDRIHRYAGLKEEIYLSDFEPRPGADTIRVEPCRTRTAASPETVPEMIEVALAETRPLDDQPSESLVSEGLPSENRASERDPSRNRKTLIVLRPPPTMAAYHRFENLLFPRVLDRIARRSDIMAILMPRTPEQEERYRSMSPENVFLLLEAADGPDLMTRVDLVVSAGGTMNREAAVLGTPAATIFQGRIGAVDRWLIEQGKVAPLGSEADVDALPLVRKTAGQRMRQPDLIEQVADMILGTRRK